MRKLGKAYKECKWLEMLAIDCLFKVSYTAIAILY